MTLLTGDSICRCGAAADPLVFVHEELAAEQCDLRAILKSIYFRI